MVICVAIYLIEQRFGITSPVYKSLALFGLNIVIAGLVFGLLDSGMFLKGSAQQRHSLNMRARRATVIS
jgi:hypothetical protein